MTVKAMDAVKVVTGIMHRLAHELRRLISAFSVKLNKKFVLSECRVSQTKFEISLSIVSTAK